ncbi:MAG: tetratricopeptide repeat protein [Nannocystis sp.]|nr:tetratricopeptide repeat protein [Nannocystis sp.]
MEDRAQRGCARATITREWDDALFDRSAWCFEDRRLQLEATVEQIATLNRASARRAVRIASYLDPVASCLDPNLLQRLPAPPLATRDEIRAIRATISESDQLRHAGRFGEALAVAASARARAEAIAWSPLLSLTHFVEGRCAYEAGQTKRADDALLRAYFAAQNDGSTEVAFRAARSLIIVYSELQRYREAEVWARHADVLAATREDPSGLDAAEGHYLLSSVRAGLGDYDAAAAAGERALAMRRDALGPDHPITAASSRSVGMIYLAQGRYREASALLERASSIWEDAVGHEHLYIAQIATLRGQAIWSIGQVDEALALLREGLAIMERVVSADHPKALRSRDALGRVLLALERVDEAEPLLLQNLDAARAQRGVRHHGYAEALLSVAEVDRARGREALALARSAEAVEILESALAPEHPDVAAALERVADIYRALGRVDEAITQRREALARREASLGLDHGQLRAPLEALGDALVEAGSRDQARASYARAVAIGERLLGPTHAALVPSLSALARLALAEGDGDAARRFAERAVRLAEGADAGPRAAADAHFALALALADGEPSTRPRALARQAHREYTTSHEEARRAEVERWLTERSGP